MSRCKRVMFADRTVEIKIDDIAQCARTDLNKRFLPKPMTTTG